MNSVKIEVEIEDDRLRQTLFQSLIIETEATKTSRGSALIVLDDITLVIKIQTQDYVAARAMTNSILRLLKASIDVAEAINIENSSK